MTVQQEFELEIIRPHESTLVSVSWVEVESLTGSFTVGPGHSPLVAILRPSGEISYSMTSGTLKKLEITSGIFSMSKGRGVIILNS